jgi:hypothetical protein
MLLMVPTASFLGLSQEFISRFLLSFVFAIVGVMLGFLYVLVIRLSHQTQRYLRIVIFTSYPLLLCITYLAFGLREFFEVCVFLLKVMFGFILCLMPMTVTYGIIKKNKSAVIAPSLGIILFFFFSVSFAGEGSLTITSENIWLFILFFILYLLFIELSLTMIDFSLMVDKLAPQNIANSFLLQRFTLVLHSYYRFLGVMIIGGFLATGGVYLFKELLVSSNPVDFLGIQIDSLVGIVFFVMITVLGVLLFWFFSPRKKQVKQGPIAKGKTL